MKTTRRKFILTTGAGLGTLAFSGCFPISSDKSPGNVRSKVVPANGVLKIEINNNIFEPLAFRSFRPEERNISEFYDAGIRLMSILHTGLNCTLDVPYSKFGEIWSGPGKYETSNIDRQMELFIENAPDTYFNIMIQLDTRDWYLRANPAYSNSYWNLVEMAGNEQWREDTATYLQDMLNYFENKYGDRIFAYSLLCGSSTEWYTNSQSKKPEASIREHPVKKTCFREFIHDQNAEIPPLETLHHTSHGIFRDPVADVEALRYWHFHHEIIGNTILYFAQKSQEILQHEKLLGLYYGYLTQLGGKRLLEEGHLAYERVWDSPDIDMILAPAKYGPPRSFNGVSGYLQTIDSLGLHKKLMFQEIDHTTNIAPTTVENGRSIPGSNTRLKDDFQTRMVLRREFVLTRVKRTALWWFDFFGGYYYSESLMKEIANMIKIQKRLTNVKLSSIAEIAVFGDVESMYYAQAFSSLAVDLLVSPPDELARIGSPYDIYNFSDLGNRSLPIDKYKLIIFLNSFKISQEKLDYINCQLKANGRSLLWIYAPNYIQEKGFSIDAISEITGISIIEHEGDDSMVTVTANSTFNQLSSNTCYSFSKKLSPLFEICDDYSQVLGVYSSNGSPALVSKKLAQHTSIYSAVGNLPAIVLREIARAAGVHIYYEGNDPVYINNRLIGIHMQSDPSHEITLPIKRSCSLEELFDGEEMPVSKGVCQLPHVPGATKLYLLDDKTDNKSSLKK